MPSRNQLLCAIVSILIIATISFGGAIATLYTAIYQTISPADVLVCQCVANKLTCGNFVKTDFVESIFININISTQPIECNFKDEKWYNFLFCDFADLQTQVETHNNVVAQHCLNKDKQEKLTIIGIELFIISLILCVIGLILSILSSYFITVPDDVPVIPMALPQPLSTSRTTTWYPKTTEQVNANTVVEIDLDKLDQLILESSVPIESMV